MERNREWFVLFHSKCLKCHVSHALEMPVSLWGLLRWCRKLVKDLWIYRQVSGALALQESSKSCWGQSPATRTGSAASPALPFPALPPSVPSCRRCWPHARPALGSLSQPVLFAGPSAPFACSSPGTCTPEPQTSGWTVLSVLLSTRFLKYPRLHGV